jgi:hypothetical protein
MVSAADEVRVVNFAISKNLRVKSTMFPHRNMNVSRWEKTVRLNIFR